MASKEVLSALDTLHRELEKLEPAIKHVETAQQITQTVKGIPQKHVELLSEVKNNDARHKGELKDIFLKELDGLVAVNNKQQKITDEILQQVKVEQQALEKLMNTVQSFHDRVEKINFPERLDKLDANVAGIMAAIQSIQGRLDTLERNLLDRLRDIFNYEKETRANLLTAVEAQKNAVLVALDAGTKKHRLFTFITWALIVLVVVAMFLLKIMKMKTYL